MVRTNSHNASAPGIATATQKQAIVDVVKHKRKNGIMPEPHEMAIAIPEDKELLFGFLMDNNLPNVVDTLKSELGERMDFKPDRAQVEAVLVMYMAKGEDSKLQKILDKFQFNRSAGNYTTDQTILATLAKFKK